MTTTAVSIEYPDYSPVCGYAATVWYSDQRPEHPKVDRWALPEHLDGTPKPVILVARQTYSVGLENLSGLFGGNMTTEFKAFGVEGVLTDGPMRDYMEIKETGVQYLATGLTSGHGPVQIRDVGIPLKVAGMTVMPGDIVHMDQCGACKFPADKLAKVLRNATELISREKKQQARFNDPSFSLGRWKAES